MKYLISGGCKNGKSFFAQQLAQKLNPENLYYIATMSPGDKEDLERIKRHQQEREGWGFKTLEHPKNIANCGQNCPAHSAFLLDSTTALLANEMFGSMGGTDFSAPDRVSKDLLSLLKTTEHIVIVSDYIYSYTDFFDEATVAYIKGLAKIDKDLAKECDVVLEFIYGSYVVHKGKEYMNFEVGK